MAARQAGGRKEGLAGPEEGERKMPFCGVKAAVKVVDGERS